MGITLRSEKGSNLTAADGDENIRTLLSGERAQVPKEQGNGIRIGPDNNLSFAWHDLHSTIHTDPASPISPAFVTYNGNIKGRSFTEGDEAFIEFHLPHDYAMGSEVFIHAHWSHNSALVTGGSVTWGFELMYAKGHNQDNFDTPILVSVAQNAAGRYRHLVAETSMTSVSGGATTLPVGIIEPDGVIMVRVYLDSNDMTVSGGGVPDPFLHFVDLHYQSTNVGTKNKSPDFWGA